MKKWCEDSDEASALRVTLIVALGFVIAVLFAFPFAAGPLDSFGQTAGASGATVSLPIDSLDNQVPIDTVLLKPVTTTNIDPSVRYVGFQADFTFNENVITFASPFVEPAGLTSTGWNVSGNILPGTGPIRTFRVSAFSLDFTPLSGSGVLYNLRMLRVSGVLSASTPLTWQPDPDHFVYIDDALKVHAPTQNNGFITISGATPTPCPECTPTPTCGTFSNPSPILVFGGAGFPYPSDITVSGVTGNTITKVTVMLSGITHPNPNNIDLLLVGPDGRNAIIMSDAGGHAPVTGVDVILDDTAPFALPRGGPLHSGIFRPANFGDCNDIGPDTFPSPAPSPSGASSLSVFNGSSPNGVWRLYAVGDMPAGQGSISSGWSITVSTENCALPTPVPTPTPGATYLVVDAPSTVFMELSFNFTVTARDQFGNLVTTYSGPIFFTSSNPTATLPSGGTLTNGVGVFSAHFLGFMHSYTLSATDTSNLYLTGTSNCIFVGKHPVTPTQTPTPPPPTTPPPTPTVAPTPTPPFEGGTLLFENFDTAVPPTLPQSWSSSFSTGPANCAPSGTCNQGSSWVTTSNNPYSGPICVFHDAPGCVTDSVLDTRTFFVPSWLTHGASLSFRSSYDLESGRDGGVLEISINGGRFVDIREAGGFVQYNGTISTQFHSPIAGRPAWTGNSNGYILSGAGLPPIALGQLVTLRFRLATDCSGSGAGWSIDEVWVSYNLLGTPAPSPAPTPSPPPVPVVCSFNEPFSSIGGLPFRGWVMRNNSSPTGIIDWFSGTSAVFTGHSGNYLAANFNAGAGMATLSDWLLTPPVTLYNGGTLRFWTRTVDSPQYPDRLQVLLSTNGTSTNVGTTATSVGDFNLLLFDLNPTYTTTDYPNTWTEYSIVLNGFATPITGRFGFRYFVENGGPNGVNSDYIGIDDVSYDCGLPPATPSPTATPTPNGKIAFARYIPPSPTPTEDGPQIYGMDSNGANQMAVTFIDTTHASRTNPKWSFDGTKLLYLERRREIPSYHYYLVIHNGPHAGTLREVNPNSEAAWSPDGNKIVFSIGGLWIINEDGTNLTDLHQSGTHPAWKPDGTKIAFATGGSIWVMNSDGSNPVNLTTNQMDSEPAWSPDGAKIAFISSRDGNAEIYAMDASGANQTRLTNTAATEDWPSWSPDGAQIAFAQGGQIYTMNADGSNQVRVTNNAYSDFQPDWRWNLIVQTPTPTPTPTLSPTATPTVTATPITPTPTPPPGVISLVSRLSDARAAATVLFLTSTPPPQVQTDFLPAALTNSAGVSGEPGIANGQSTSNSQITVDNAKGTVLVTGDGTAMSGALGGGTDAHASAGATLMRLTFQVSQGSPSYSLTGELSTGGKGSQTATAKLSDEHGVTVFEIVAGGVGPPSITLSEAGFLPTGVYTFVVNLETDVTGSPFGNGSQSSGNFSLTLAAGTVSTPTPAPTPTATSTPTPSPTPVQVAHAQNLSTRLFVGTGDDVGVAGFIIAGTDPIGVLLRGIGPSLAGAGVTNALPDPYLELRDASGALIVAVDGGCYPSDVCIKLGIPPTNNLEPTIVITLTPGAYTAILGGTNNTTGLGLVEVYDLGSVSGAKPSRQARGPERAEGMANISTRGQVGTGPEILIGGIIIGGATTDDRILIRGIGPSLSASGVPNALSNPALELRNSDGVLILANDDWQNGPPVTLPPTDALEAAIETTVSPGAYTALLFGEENGTGVGLVEVYDLGP